ncbi:MAG: GTPase [Candidatus Odinarchaeota archaeon]
MLRRRKEHRLVYKMIVETDITVEVLDARFPDLSRCRNIEKFVRSKNKPLLFCMNKCDLVPQEILEQWKKILSSEAITVYVSTREHLGTSMIRKELFRAAKKKKGSPIRSCLIGLPNTGKSSLINVLAGRHSARVSPRPGYTRSLQYVRISPQLLMVDTPGISPVDSYSVEEKMFLGAISADKEPDIDIIAGYFIQRIYENSPESIKEYLDFEPDISDPEEVLGQLALKRGKLLSGGIPDIQTVSKILIKDFQQGKIPYCESPTVRKL